MSGAEVALIEKQSRHSTASAAFFASRQGRRSVALFTGVLGLVGAPGAGRTAGGLGLLVRQAVLEGLGCAAQAFVRGRPYDDRRGLKSGLTAPWPGLNSPARLLARRRQRHCGRHCRTPTKNERHAAGANPGRPTANHPTSRRNGGVGFRRASTPAPTCFGVRCQALTVYSQGTPEGVSQSAPEWLLLRAGQLADVGEVGGGGIRRYVRSPGRPGPGPRRLRRGRTRRLLRVLPSWWPRWGVVAGQGAGQSGCGRADYFSLQRCGVRGT